jgi:hypothetical protein
VTARLRNRIGGHDATARRLTPLWGAVHICTIQMCIGATDCRTSSS